MTEPQKEYIITEARLYQMEHGYQLKTNAKEVRLCPYITHSDNTSDVLDELHYIIYKRVKDWKPFVVCSTANKAHAIIFKEFLEKENPVCKCWVEKLRTKEREQR